MSIQLRPISVSERQADTLRRITGKADASDAALVVLNQALKREQASARRDAALSAYQPSQKVIAALHAIDAAMNLRETGAHEKRKSIAKLTAIKRSKAGRPN